MTLKIYNTESGGKEEFEPLEEGKVKMYVCGTTDYDYIHIGHARTYIIYDVIVRFLENLGYDVKYVQNITDVGHLTGGDEGEDKVEKKAREERKEPMEIVEHFMTEHLRDIDRLKIRRPDVMPRATGHIIEMQDMVQEILDNGYAYEKDGSIYFDVQKYAEDHEYGKLRNIDLEELGESRVDNKEKKNPADFALWVNASKEHIMNWRSPWGEGYPGWHIECSTMGTKYLGEEFDIHGGAIELAFPHHENEIAQSVAANDKEPVKYWIHTGLVNVSGEKMSKSKGNFTTVKEALSKYAPEVIRLWALSSHYRKPSDFSEKSVMEAKEKLEKIKNSMRRIEEELENSNGSGETELSDRIKKKKEEFYKEMKDDFNFPNALAAIFNLINLLNKNIDEGEGSKEDYENVLDFLKLVLGRIFVILPEEEKTRVEEEKLVDLILQVRKKLREEENYKLSDRIRRGLEEIGIEVQDTEEGMKWNFK